MNISQDNARQSAFYAENDRTVDAGPSFDECDEYNENGSCIHSDHMREAEEAEYRESVSLTGDPLREDNPNRAFLFGYDPETW